VTVRSDRGYYTQVIWAGLFCTGIYVFMNKETIPAFTEAKGNILGGILGLAAGVCLVASFLKDWRLAFRIELYGLGVIVACLVVLDFTAPLTLWQMMTLVGGLGIPLQIGSIRMMAHLVRALRDPPTEN
jgi:hypothetical protein